jgi:hypothetical protein
MIDYTLILSTNYADSEWTLDGDDYQGLTWLSETKKPTKNELDSQWQNVLEKIEANKAAKKAKRESALAKLAALGLEEDDLKALGL